MPLSKVRQLGASDDEGLNVSIWVDDMEMCCRIILTLFSQFLPQHCVMPGWGPVLKSC